MLPAEETIELESNLFGVAEALGVAGLGEEVEEEEPAEDDELAEDMLSVEEDEDADLAELPEGEPEDPPDAETVKGVGNNKNVRVLKLIHDQGVEPYEGSVRYLREVQSAGLPRAVVSSSTNCRDVLKAAGIDHFRRFTKTSDALRVCGNAAARRLRKGIRLL